MAEVSYQVTYVSDLSDNQHKSTQTATKTLKLGYGQFQGKLSVNQLTLWSGKLDELKEQIKEVNAAVPEVGSSTTIVD